MDLFGIGEAMKALVIVYYNTARQTGRTTHMLKYLKDGDRICFADRREADRVRRICKDLSLDVKCIVINPSKLHGLHNLPRSTGRTIFDHSWVERFYIDAISHAGNTMTSFEERFSGRPQDDAEKFRRAEWRVP